jgi:hypothetical protein
VAAVVEPVVVLVAEAAEVVVKVAAVTRLLHQVVAVIKPVLRLSRLAEAVAVVATKLTPRLIHRHLALRCILTVT